VDQPRNLAKSVTVEWCVSHDFCFFNL